MVGKARNDDRDVVSAVCFYCSHWWGYTAAGKFRCDAYPDRDIPDDIWQGLDPHTAPRAGDGGVQFEAGMGPWLREAMERARERKRRQGR